MTDIEQTRLGRVETLAEQIRDGQHGLDTRLVAVETKLETLAEQWEKRFTQLQWVMGIGFTWLTLLIAAINLLKR